MRSWRFRLLVLVVLSSGRMVAGQSEERPLAAEFPLKMGTTVQVRGTELTIGLVRVTDDSRCPVEAQCITAGDAGVVLSVRSGRARAAAVTLHTGGSPRETTHGAWRIRLMDLAPQPSLRQPPIQKDYVATLRVDAAK